MDRTRRSFLGAALAAVACFAFWSAQGGAPSVAQAAASYQTRCVVIDATTVEGFVTNGGPVLLQISGLIRFSVVGEYSVTRPSVQVHSSALIPPGSTVSVGRARLPAVLLPGESCQVDVSGAIAR